VLAIELNKGAADRQARQLFQQQTALAAASQAQFANQLFISGFAPGRACNTLYQFTIGHGFRVGYSPMARLPAAVFMAIERQCGVARTAVFEAPDSATVKKNGALGAESPVSPAHRRITIRGIADCCEM
jgi:hypothetical protein